MHCPSEEYERQLSIKELTGTHIPDELIKELIQSKHRSPPHLKQYGSASGQGEVIN